MLSLPLDKQQVIWIPEIITETIDKDTQFLIIACDGIWDWMNNDEAVRFIIDQNESLRKVKEESFKVSDISACIFDKNLAKDTFSSSSDSGKEGAGCDNMTSVVVMFKHPE